MINYLLRETKLQERLRLGKLLIADDRDNFDRLDKYYIRRNEYIKGVK